MFERARSPSLTLLAALLVVGCGADLSGFSRVDDDDAAPLDDDDATAAPGCLADPQEPNDELAQATELETNGMALELTFGPFTACGEGDWHALLIPAHVGATLRVGFAHAEGDIDVYLHDDSGAQVDASTTSNDIEEVSFPVGSEARTWYLRVELVDDQGNSPGNRYVVDPVDVVFGACDGQDYYEPNDTAQTAVPLWTDFFYPYACPDDHDWFSIDLAAGDQLDFHLDYEADEGNLDLFFRDTDLNVVAEATTETDDEDLSWLAGASGTLLIEIVQVSDAGATVGQEYWMQTSGVDLCRVDFWEDDDHPDEASPLRPEGQVFTVCADDADWYTTIALAGETVDARIALDDAEGDVDLALFDPAGLPLVTGSPTAEGASLSHVVEVDGWYDLEVSLGAEAGGVPGNTYALDLAVD